MLFTLSPDQECDVVTCRDLAGALAAWQCAVRTSNGASGLLHTGFARPDTADVRAVLMALPPGLYVTEAARHAVPRECVVGGRKAGTCQGRDLTPQGVYRAVGEWFGIALGSDVELLPSQALEGGLSEGPPSDLSPASLPPMWLTRLGKDHPDTVALLESENVRTDEDYQQHRRRLPDTVRHRTDWYRFRVSTDGISLVDPFVIANLLPDWATGAPLRALGLSQRCRNVFMNARLRTVADVLSLGPIGIMELRNFGRTSLKEFTERLYYFAAGLSFEGIAYQHENAASQSREVLPEVASFASPPGAEDGERDESPATPPDLGPLTLRTALELSLAGLRERHAKALRLWLGVEGPPKVLEDIGGELGVTRERARQLRNRAWDHIREHYRWPGELVLRIEGLLNGRAEPLFLDLIAADDPWFDGFQDNLVALSRLIDDLADDQVHVWPLEGRLIATRCSAEHWQELVDAARVAVEREIPAGMTRSDAQILVEAVAVEQRSPDLADPLWMRLATSLHFAASPSGDEQLVSVGRGLRHALAAILNESDRPLHMSEIIARLCQRGYLRSNDYASQNMVRSAVREAGAVLYGRSVYGLDKHLLVSSEVAEEALAELETIIFDGASGRQWHCSELAEALSARRPDWGEELDAFAVNIILSRSSVLTYLGRLVWVGSRSTDGLQDRLDIAAMCEAALLEAGRPLTKREMRDAIRRVRGLNRHFLPQPSERVIRLAHGMWGLADRDVGVSAENQNVALGALFRALEERERGLHVTELFSALENIRFSPDPELDEWELLGLAQSDPRFRVGRGQLVGLRIWPDVRRCSIGQAFADLQARWTGPKTGDQLHGVVCSMVERDISRASLASHAARSGFVYDATTALWDLADLSEGVVTVTEEES